MSTPDHTNNVTGTENRTGISRLGFGTSMLGGRIGPRRSLYLLELAYDLGLRHFDTAPMYGYGSAENIVGHFLSERRDQVTIATKFGIEPPTRSAAMTMAKTIAKAVVSLAPGLRSRIAKRANSMVRGGDFDVPYASMSMKRSIASLKSGYIDVLLMHEVKLEQISPELMDFLESAVMKGDIMRYGVASDHKEMLRIATSSRSYGSVAQFPDGGFDTVLNFLPASTLRITHSVLGKTFKTLVNKLAADPTMSRMYSRTLDIDCSDSSNVGALFLWAALRRNSSGIVLFSSVNPDNIRRNTVLLDSATFCDAQVTALDSLLDIEHAERTQEYAVQ